MNLSHTGPGNMYVLQTDRDLILGAGGHVQPHIFILLVYLVTNYLDIMGQVANLGKRGENHRFLLDLVCITLYTHLYFFSSQKFLLQ